MCAVINEMNTAAKKSKERVANGERRARGDRAIYLAEIKGFYEKHNILPSAAAKKDAKERELGKKLHILKAYIGSVMNNDRAKMYPEDMEMIEWLAIAGARASNRKKLVVSILKETGRLPRYETARLDEKRAAAAMYSHMGRKTDPAFVELINKNRKQRTSSNEWIELIHKFYDENKRLPSIMSLDIQEYKLARRVYAYSAGSKARYYPYFRQWLRRIGSTTA
jgi:hypothetical protein